ncbi:MAG TPA: hypothetical protein DD417_10850 [Elusimicrobia bacterium]|nr:hypothetical protein [Elusimicrobiota bacterium]
MSVTVLIVEDNKEHGRMVEAAVRSIGWEPRSTELVETGFRMALEAAPSLLITDVHLPDSDGYDLVRRIRSHPELKHVPILMITGTYHRDEDRLRAFELGADAYLLKPVHVGELLLTARRLVDVRRRE